MAYTRKSQGFTLGWYAMPRWGDLRLIFTIVNPMNDLILYTTEDGRSQIKLRAKDETVWLTQLEMAELFASSKQNIGQHLKSIFEEGELMEASVVKQHFTTAADGKDYSTKLYNLDAILAVGYRVRSPRGVQFRRCPPFPSSFLAIHSRCRLDREITPWQSISTNLSAFASQELDCPWV